MFFKILTFIVLLSIPSFAFAKETPRVVILHYKDIGTTPYSSVTPDQFQKHIKTLQKEERKIISFHSLEIFLKSAEEGDVAYIISFENITPENIGNFYNFLKTENIPFIAFIEPKDWKEPSKSNFLRESNQTGIAVYGLKNYILTTNKDVFKSDLNKAVSDFRDILSKAPDYYLIPEGLYTENMLEITKDYKFDTIMGAAQGIVTNTDNVIMRYDVNFQNADPDRFRRLLDIRPLLISDPTPLETLITELNPNIGFTLIDDIKEDSDLRCFLQGVGKIPHVRLTDNRIELRPEFLPASRNYLNCILKEFDGNNYKYKWHGFLYEVPAADQIEADETTSQEALEDIYSGDGEKTYESEAERLENKSANTDEADLGSDINSQDELPESQE